MPIVDISGQRFGRLTVTRMANSDKQGIVRWDCLCDCGNTKRVRGSSLRTGATLSCGCYHKDELVRRLTTHAASKSREFLAWLGAKGRCYNQRNTKFEHYGGRGIKVASEWLDNFQAFLDHIGPCPSLKHTLDRWPDKNGDYAPGNVRWATCEEQNNNRRVNRYVTVRGESMTVSQAAKRFGIPRGTIMHRLRTGAEVIK